MTDSTKRRLQNEAKEVRKEVIRMILKAHASHIASAYSVVELLVYLYDCIIKIDPKKPQDSERDRTLNEVTGVVSAITVVRTTTNRDFETEGKDLVSRLTGKGFRKVKTQII